VHTTRVAEGEDIRAAARLLHAFNVEFGEPTPDVDALADRLGTLIDGGDTAVLVAGDGPDGVAVLRFRLAIWSAGLECYLAELYVRPEIRGGGLGRALMESSIAVARARGADTIDLGTEETDTVARILYEHMGFTNRDTDGAQMLYYERAL
jgi:ribosomal protein S18 acetylase RimI-like enzyme